MKNKRQIKVLIIVEIKINNKEVIKMKELSMLKFKIVKIRRNKIFLQKINLMNNFKKKIKNNLE
jgi:hypothetical protein